MKKSVFTIVFAAVSAVMAMTPVFAGDPTTPTGAPGAAGSAMFTLEDIYQRLLNGAAGTKRVGPFANPASGPGPTGHTLNDVMGKAPATDTNGASPAEVLSGKTFWGLTGGAWGFQTGTLACAATAAGTATAGDVLSGKTFSNSSANGITGTMADKGGMSFTPGATAQTIAAGYYNGTGTVAGDADLISANIKNGVNIFGVIGTYPLAAVPITGQTTSYSAGDDGALQKGVASPSPRFTDNGNGTVKDNITGLIWLKNANCANAMRTWANALSDVASLNSGGTMNGNNCGNTGNHTDWRLPNRRELASLTHDGYFNPALSNTAGTGQWTAGNPFINVQSDIYWSATTVAISPAYAWGVHLGDSHVGGVDKSFTVGYVCPVR